MPTAIPDAADIQRPLTLPQYAALLGVTTRTVRKRCQAGLVPGATRVSDRGDWRIPFSAVPVGLRPPETPTETLRQRKARSERGRQLLLAMK